MIPRYTLPAMGALWSDANRLRVMLDVELAVLDAQARLGLVPRKAVAAIRRKAAVDLAQVRRREATTQHDVIAFVEQLESRVGPEGRFIHFGLTSSDVLDTSLAILMRRAADLLLGDLRGLVRALAVKARRHKRTLMIGRTHGIHAEPMTFGLKLASFYDEFRRHLRGLELARAEVSVGKISGAVGTFANVDPRVERQVCRRFGLTPAPISTQIVQRDVHAVLMARVALVGASIEKLATEIRHLQRTEVGEAQEPFGRGQKGSSAMPHKQNPVTCERLTGLARLLRGHALAAMENVALWHERDISHSSVERVILPDATITLDYMLQTMTAVIRGLVVNRQRMRANLEQTRGAVYSGQVLQALMRRGLSRARAYALVQRAALSTQRNASHSRPERDGGQGRAFEEALLADREIRRHLKPAQVRACVDPRRHLRHVGYIFRRVGL
jgi:adenylosuccinate lyase